jgi:hypothetical protein
MLIVLVTQALAGEYAAQARELMQLDFDLEDVRAKLAAPAAAPPAPIPDAPARAALPLAPNSTLEHVVVLRDRAIVTRVRTVELPAGTSRIRFEGLPLGLDASTLHAEVRRRRPASSVGRWRRLRAGSARSTSASPSRRPERWPGAWRRC